MLIAGSRPIHSVTSVLCLGAHADDIEIGCGGTLLKLRTLNPALDVTVVVLSGDEPRLDEARRSAAALPGDRRVEFIAQSFRDSYFPYCGAELKDCFNQLARGRRPDVIFTHARHDLHQDHRLVSDLTWNAFRDHLILEYEIPKYDGDLGSPNTFVALDRATCDRKIEHLRSCFPTQADKPWFSSETFIATLRLRGVECRSPDGYAEGFYARKLILA